MFIIFSSREEAPTLPDLGIKDAETLLSVPVAGIEGWDDDFLQTQTLCTAPLSFSAEEASLAALTETGAHWIQRKSKILLKLNFSNSGANAVVYPVYYDENGVVSVGASVTITALSRQEGLVYMAPLETFDTLGASQVTFYIESISAGTIDARVAGV